MGLEIVDVHFEIRRRPTEIIETFRYLKFFCARGGSVAGFQPRHDVRQSVRLLHPRDAHEVTEQVLVVDWQSVRNPPDLHETRRLETVRLDNGFVDLPLEIDPIALRVRKIQRVELLRRMGPASCGWGRLRTAL